MVAGPGYDVYYPALNFLAGASRVMAVTEDPSMLGYGPAWKERSLACLLYDCR